MCVSVSGKSVPEQKANRMHRAYGAKAPNKQNTDPKNRKPTGSVESPGTGFSYGWSPADDI